MLPGVLYRLHAVIRAFVSIGKKPAEAVIKPAGELMCFFYKHGAAA